jgi:hypothetical protein
MTNKSQCLDGCTCKLHTIYSDDKEVEQETFDYATYFSKQSMDAVAKTQENAKNKTGLFAILPPVKAKKVEGGVLGSKECDDLIKKLIEENK